MNVRSKMFFLSLGVVVVFSGLLGCGKKEEEAAPVDPAKEGQFTAPAVKTNVAPGGGTGTASKPVTQ